MSPNNFVICLITLWIGSLFQACQSPNADQKELCRVVNPFIGTGGHGHTYPGATVPFGMVQLSPDTRLEGWDGCSGYHFTDSIIYGFSHTHLSGTGVSDYGDILMMPTQGEPIFNNGANGQAGYRSLFKKSTESAHAGYYAVHLDDHDIQVELTATERAGFHQYHFNRKGKANLIVDLTHRDETLDAGLRWVSPTEIEGYRISKAWAEEQHVYFVAQFSEPIIDYTLDGAVADLSSQTYQNVSIKAAFHFELPNHRKLLLKVGISAVDIEGARRNLLAEIPHFDFEKTKREAEEKWNAQLGKIEIESLNPDDKVTFYSALYHTAIVPNIFSDVDGRYRGMDKRIHQAKEGHTQYTVFSIWDTYRATHPLYTILEQKRTKDFIQTFLNQYVEGGRLPVWELAGNETNCMIGYHANSVIADAYLKGIRDFDATLALKAMVEFAEKDEFGKKAYLLYGFIPSDQEPESVSKTLEYAYDDWCTAQMAMVIGQDSLFRKFTRRSQAFKNLYDPSSGFMRAKHDNRWFAPFDPFEVNFNYTEANSWQYSFYVPHDIAGLIDLHGGNDVFEKIVDSLFAAPVQTTGREQSDITGLIGQYAHGNEPSHHMAYLYQYLGKSWKTDKRIREIMRTMYHNAPDGLSGNEDCGQMSAWYVFSALGFYPVTPGSNEYVFGTPLVKKASIRLENGNFFKIESKHLSEKNLFVQSIWLNGQPLLRKYLRHEEIMAGGELVFEMGARPMEKVVDDPAALPTSSIKEQLIVPVPTVLTGKKAFLISDSVTLNCPLRGVEIKYTLNGQTPGPAFGETYSAPFEISETTVLQAIAIHPELGQSQVVTSHFYKIPKQRNISILHSFANQYSAGGELALLDFETGGPDFRTGQWQGYEGVDLVATIDLGEKEPVKTVSINFLQDENAWIFMPLAVEFFVSDDGRIFKQVGTVQNEISYKVKGAIRHTFTSKINQRPRYLKIRGINRQTCPSDHKGAGGKSWIFADEITIL